MSILSGILNGVDQNSPDGLIIGPASVRYDEVREHGKTDGEDRWTVEAEGERRKVYKRVIFTFSDYTMPKRGGGQERWVHVGDPKLTQSRTLFTLNGAQARKLAETGTTRTSLTHPNEQEDVTFYLQPEDAATFAAWLQNPPPLEAPKPVLPPADYKDSATVLREYEAEKAAKRAQGQKRLAVGVVGAAALGYAWYAWGKK